MSVQVIERDGKPEWAVIPYEEYERLVEEAEMLQDVRAYDEAKKAIAKGEELVPSEVTYAILDGGNPVRVPYLSQIESGKRRGSAEVLAAIAKELGLSLDDIVGS
jgi:hypothetical protein